MNKYLLQSAISLAVEKHASQLDKAGLPYILHPLKVMFAVESMGITHMIVAVLHDTVEETSVTLNEIESSYGMEVRTAVEAISKKPESAGETYMEFIARTSKNEIARVIKKADIAHNLSRMDALSDGERVFLIKRYTRALTLLKQPNK